MNSYNSFVKEFDYLDKDRGADVFSSFICSYIDELFSSNSYISGLKYIPSELEDEIKKLLDKQ